MPCRETEASQTSGTLTTATSHVTQNWCCPTYKRSTLLTLKNWCRTKPAENRSHLLCPRPGRHSSSRKYHARSCGGTSPVCRRPASGQSSRHPGCAWTRAAVSGPADRICPPPRQASAELTTSSECMVAQFFKKKKASNIFEVGQRSLERFFPGFT